MANSFLLFISNLLFSMDIDFDDFFEDSMKIGQIIGIVFAVITVLIIVMVIVSAIKAKNKTSGYIKNIKDKMVEKIEEQKTKDICEYCGSKLKPEENRCPNCGAQRKK